MKKALAISLYLSIIILILASFAQDTPQKSKFQSAHSCKKCHAQDSLGNQSGIWEESLHAKSYSALTNEEFVASAKERGLDPLPGDNSQCLACHAPLHERASEFMAEGVNCEVCHDPEKDHEKKKDIKAWCLTCHENAHNKTFDFPTAWKKIKHAVPKTEE